MALTDMTTQASKETLAAFRAVMDRDKVRSELHASLAATGADKFLTPQRLAQVGLTLFAKTPKLWECDPRAIIRCLVECAGYGLVPGTGPHAMAYFIPFKKECSVVVTYHGYLAMARRNPAFSSVEARCVFERDLIEMSFGFDKKFSHSPYIGAESPGKLVGAYVVWKEGKDHNVHWMGHEDIMARANASPSAQRGGGAWQNWRNEMAIKCVIKGAAKLWPRQEQLDAAVHNKEGDHRELVVDMPSEQLGQPQAQYNPPAGDNRADAIATRLEQRRALRSGQGVVKQEEEPMPAQTQEAGNNGEWDYGSPDSWGQGQGGDEPGTRG